MRSFVWAQHCSFPPAFTLCTSSTMVDLIDWWLKSVCVNRVAQPIIELAVSICTMWKCVNVRFPCLQHQYPPSPCTYVRIFTLATYRYWKCCSLNADPTKPDVSSNLLLQGSTYNQTTGPTGHPSPPPSDPNDQHHVNAQDTGPSGVCVCMCVCVYVRACLRVWICKQLIHETLIQWCQ